MGGYALEEWRRLVDRRKTEFDTAKEAVIRARVKVSEAEDRVDDLLCAQRILQEAGRIVQQEAHGKIAGVVSHCLSSVFDEPYQFKIKFEKKRGRTEAKLVFVRDGEEISPLDAAGGGVVDVAAFALRLACLMLRRPVIRRVLILDEPFRFVSAEYRPAVRRLLESLSVELGVQFIIVTHIEELVMGKVVRLGSR